MSELERKIDNASSEFNRKIDNASFEFNRKIDNVEYKIDNGLSKLNSKIDRIKTGKDDPDITIWIFNLLVSLKIVLFGILVYLLLKK
ncbi:hypothetical protein F0310_05365 (plasmid) [Borrelia sp. A-FGy1]|uniref:hypothetical protein n=1 Tax=Borrelia sp. A-FGy1 TaxID=2608247 RepID=UPI0015F3B803|nr:hypothetical protein [Borrelia sp. A-FGy1]QMU99843.1 hypothetical protein F0310_05365 [Borrelia sp. A-FGy1]